MKHLQLVETGSNHKVKILQSDNGTEFRNLEMEEFCKEKGIAQQFFTPGTPQQWSSWTQE